MLHLRIFDCPQTVFCFVGCSVFLRQRRENENEIDTSEGKLTDGQRKEKKGFVHSKQYSDSN